MAPGAHEHNVCTAVLLASGVNAGGRHCRGESGVALGSRRVVTLQLGMTAGRGVREGGRASGKRGDVAADGVLDSRGTGVKSAGEARPRCDGLLGGRPRAAALGDELR